MDQATFDLLLGPLGLTVGLVGLVGLFVTERIVPGSRVKRAETALENAVALAKQANDALEKMADALEERNQLDREVRLAPRAGGTG